MEQFEEIFKSEGYLLEELLFRDEWGELYRARYVPHARELLLRRFPPGLAADSAGWGLVRAEVQAWARIDHPGILQVLDWGVSTGGAGEAGAGRAGTGAPAEAFLATEMPAGTRLDAFLEGRAAADGEAGDASQVRGAEDEAIVRTMLDAVETACQWGVLHLGLSPSCVWVGPGGRAQVAGFGLWYVNRDFPAWGGRDDPFLAPEQRAGERVSAATDVYSLAMLAVEVYAGAGAAGAVASGAPLPDAHAGVSPVLARCLDPRPLARYRTAGELAVALGVGAAGSGAATDEHSDYQEHVDCPLCRLKSEIERDALAGGRGGERTAPGAGGSPAAVSYAWLIAAVLAVACVVVWWMALR